MSETESRGRLHHGWIEVIVAGVALIVSAVSLWVGIRTEVANEQMVAASTWPFLQVQVSNANPDGSLNLQFMVVNTGVGPAKIESFEVFWKNRPMRSAIELAQACCGYKVVKSTSPEAKNVTPLITGTVQGIVLRAGEEEKFIGYEYHDDNHDVWTRFNDAREQMSYRICYCSVLNECWRSNLKAELYMPGQLNPEKVKACPAPKVGYIR